MPQLHVEIIRWVDDSQPGWVECGIVDAHGVAHSFVEKVPIVTTDDVTPETSFPCRGEIRCTFVSRYELPDGRSVFRVDTTLPDHIESTAGLTLFDVTSRQLFPDEVVRAVVATGMWLYAASVPCRVRIIESNVAFGSGDYEDEPHVAEDRAERCYYVEWAPHDDPDGTSAGVGPFTTIEDARAHVHAASNATVAWDAVAEQGRPTTA